jgi:serine/threonine-protein kinase
LEFISAAGRVCAVFDQRTQDSGNVSYGVETDRGRYFVKTAGSPDHASAALPHNDRVELLRNVVQLHRRVRHPALIPLQNVIESPQGPILVFDWAAGELLGAPAVSRSDPSSAYVRFRRLPVPRVVAVLDQIMDLHTVLATAGYVAVDFYDGSLIYDFQASLVRVFDLDSYHLGPFVNRMGRMFGSTRFMSPEEFTFGAEISERTTVHVLGRTVIELLTDPLTGSFRGSSYVHNVARRASARAPADRYGSVAELVGAWRDAEGPAGGRLR